MAFAVLSHTPKSTSLESLHVDAVTVAIPEQHAHLRATTVEEYEQVATHCTAGKAKGPWPKANGSWSCQRKVEMSYFGAVVWARSGEVRLVVMGCLRRLLRRLLRRPCGRTQPRLHGSRVYVNLSEVIVSFGNGATEDVYHGVSSRRARAFSAEVQKAARRKMLMIAAAINIVDLRIPPGNRLEPLSGDWAGFWSVRVNDQWRIVFRWADGSALEVALVDYH